MPGACWKLKEDKEHGFNLFDLSDKLRARGWQIASYSLPPDCEDVVIQRVLVRNGFNKDMADILIDDFKTALKYFEKNPVTHFMTEAEGGGHRH